MGLLRDHGDLTGYLPFVKIISTIFCQAPECLCKYRLLKSLSFIRQMVISLKKKGTG